MLERPGDYLKKKARQLGLERGDFITAAQAYMDGRWPGQVRVLSFNGGLVRLVTPNAALASELRLGQLEILRELRRRDPAVEQLAVTIG